MTRLVTRAATSSSRLHRLFRGAALGACVACSFVLSFADAASANELTTLPAAIDRIRPAIVAIGTVEPTRNPQFQFLGTGFVVGDGTLIATNSHVVPVILDPAKREVVSIAVPQPGGDAIVREAIVVARDPDHDLAVLRLTGPPLSPVRLGDSNGVREGQTFAFTGFPLGSVIGLYPTTHHALISAVTPVALPQANSRSLDAALVRRLRRDRFVIFQLDATAYPGNSGSPMFNVETGDVIAIVNMVFVKGGKETALTQPSGISYAIPSSHLAKIISSVQSEGR
ncbi:MAG: S1C family serine protease [Burkholderiaceae bacterium]